MVLLVVVLVMQLVLLSVLGNSATATKLQTARNIKLDGAVTGNANFDGSGNATINTTPTMQKTTINVLNNTTDKVDIEFKRCSNIVYIRIHHTMKAGSGQSFLASATINNMPDFAKTSETNVILCRQGITSSVSDGKVDTFCSWFFKKSSAGNYSINLVGSVANAVTNNQEQIFTGMYIVE